MERDVDEREPHHGHRHEDKKIAVTPTAKSTERTKSCHRSDKKKVAPYEELILYGQLFEKNSIRSQLFDTVVLEATDAKRLPNEAEAVLAEVKIRFLEHNRESDLQRKERLQSQWMNLQMSKG